MSFGSTYTFEAQPKTVANRVKFRPEPKTNIMFDKRVVRGNTYAAPPPVEEPIPHKSVVVHHQKAISLEYSNEEKENAPTGKVSSQSQTDSFLEELADQIFEQESTTQTEFIEDLPPPPKFVPRPYGVDAGTQIQSGDLFNFETSVVPLLEVLVGKSLDHALAEVCEEEEVRALDEKKIFYLGERNLLIAETERLEQEAIRHTNEKQRRVNNEKERELSDQEKIRRIAAQRAASSFLQNLQSSVFQELERAGLLGDRIRDEISQSFFPWLYSEIQEHIQIRRESVWATEDILSNIIENTNIK